MTRGRSRREFLALVVAGVATACTSSADHTGSPTSLLEAGTPPPVPAAPAELHADPFALGVASGDPTASSVILWTRLVGDLGTQPVQVAWTVARDEAFEDVVGAGVATAEAGLGHSVHVDASALEADSWFWYRFALGPWTSPTGRARTAPAAGQLPASDRARFGFASCQSWQDGYYTAYPHLVDDRLDAVLFLGDFIYEGGPSDGGVRRHDTAEVTDLAGYRERYALYLSDPALRDARASCPWVVTWDDHEVDNDYAGDNSEHGDDPSAFDQRRAAGYQAFYEHQPLRIAAPTGPEAQLYRRLEWGSLATVHVLDGRQYRSDQPCSPQGSPTFGLPCGQESSPDQTMLGPDQRAWLLDGLATSTTTWDVLANQTVMTRMPIGGSIYNFDQWDGYDAERRQILDAAAQRPDGNLVVVTGDIHAFGVGDLQATDGGAVAGAEFVGGSITSRFPEQFATVVQDSIGSLDQIHFADLVDHGYGVIELTPQQCRCDLRAVTTIAEPEAGIDTLGSWVVDAGTPGARQA